MPYKSESDGTRKPASEVLAQSRSLLDGFEPMAGDFLTPVESFRTLRPEAIEAARRIIAASEERAAAEGRPSGISKMTDGSVQFVSSEELGQIVVVELPDKHGHILLDNKAQGIFLDPILKANESPKE